MGFRHHQKSGSGTPYNFVVPTSESVFIFLRRRLIYSERLNNLGPKSTKFDAKNHEYTLRKVFFHAKSESESKIVTSHHVLNNLDSKYDNNFIFPALEIMLFREVIICLETI